MRVYLSKDTPSEGEWADMWRAAVLGFFGKLDLRGIQMKWWNIHWGRRNLRVGLPDFHPSSNFPRWGDFPYLAQIRTVMAVWWVLICKPNFMEHNDHQVTLRYRRFLPFPTFLCLSPRILSLKMCGFLSVWKLLLPFVCLWTPAVYKMCDFQPPGPCSYLLLWLL